jgi:hypothetical protein
MRATLAYTSARILLFIAVLAVLYLIGARGLALLALALLISGIVSFVVLSRARDRMSASLTSRVSSARLRQAPGADAAEPAETDTTQAEADTPQAEANTMQAEVDTTPGGAQADPGSGEPSRARAGQPSGARPGVLAGVRSRLSEFSQRLDEGTRVEDED